MSMRLKTCFVLNSVGTTKSKAYTAFFLSELESKKERKGELSSELLRNRTGPEGKRWDASAVWLASGSFIQVGLVHRDEGHAIPTHKEVLVWAGGSHCRGEGEAQIDPNWCSSFGI